MSQFVTVWGVDLSSCEGQVFYHPSKEAAEEEKKWYDENVPDTGPYDLVHVDIDVTDLPRALRWLLNGFDDDKKPYPP